MATEPQLPDARHSAQASTAETVAARAEFRWAAAVMAIIFLLVGMMIYMSLHFVTMPPSRVETVDPTTLHLAGEFVEANLGSAIESDGSVVVRVVGSQYAFTPQCILVPTDTPVRFRVTSADVVHGFNIASTNVNVMLVPGYISALQTRFHKAAELAMPCHEFCGIGHAAMWAHVKVIERTEFLRRAQDKQRLSCDQP
jgi:cytochrome c oxidase subunit 2